MAKSEKKKIKAKAFFNRQGRAICDAQIATIYQGKRIVRRYLSGQPLMGRLAERIDGMF